MSDRKILYEAKLATEGRKLTRAGLAALILWTGAGAVLCFFFDSFPSNILAVILFAIGATILAGQTVRVFRQRHNPGVYRISIDDYGLYVHSDDPSSAPSFSVVAPDLCCLVRKTIKQYESCDDHEYYVETKSGTRHRIEQLFADYDLNVTELFEKIALRFPWVQMLEEVKQ
ncbi:MAG TPA: hypothetical protein VFC07_15160 [Verrucomicrobiae bacterium]|nr:hypothetical protein [Verrucomicrobiae bacterium]